MLFWGVQNAVGSRSTRNECDEPHLCTDTVWGDTHGNFDDAICVDSLWDSLCECVYRTDERGDVSKVQENRFLFVEKRRIMKALGKYMFVRNPTKSSTGKTSVWIIEDGDGDILGDVAWFGRWRCYAFHPEIGTLFNAGCMRELADFCETETNARRKK